MYCQMQLHMLGEWEEGWILAMKKLGWEYTCKQKKEIIMEY